MSTDEEVWRFAMRGERDVVERMLDEEGVDVDSKDEVSVCVLYLLILVLFGIVWKNFPLFMFPAGPVGCVASAGGSRSEPADQE